MRQVRNLSQIFYRKSISNNTASSGLESASNANRWNVERLKQGQRKQTNSSEYITTQWCRRRGCRGASTPPKVLICRKSGAQRFAEKHMKTFFRRTHQKRSRWSLWEKICRQNCTKTFRASLGNSGKILRIPKNLPAPAPASQQQLRQLKLEITSFSNNRVYWNFKTYFRCNLNVINRHTSCDN